MSSREQFEAWAEKNGHDIYRSGIDGAYYFQSTQWSWDIWQAATSALEGKCAALAAESEERRQFILNGVEMGFIRLPDEDTKDPAKEIYERCLNGFQPSPCQKCNDTGMTDSGGTQPWGEPIEIECDCLAAKPRKGGAA